MAGEDWNDSENDLTISLYLTMLEKQLAGEPFVKAHLYQELLPRLNGRSRQSLEFKLRNVSAALSDLGVVTVVNGLLPLPNAQLSLRQMAAEKINADRELNDLMVEAVDAPPTSLTGNSVGDNASTPSVDFVYKMSSGAIPALKIDYVKRDMDNAKRGLAGELAVIEFEQRQLITLGRPDLAHKVEHVSLRDDRAGFDVLSFDAETTNEKYIEVKTTSGPKESLFYLTRNELERSEKLGASYELFRLFRFECKDVGHYRLHGSLKDTLTLEPHTYMAAPRSV